LLVVLVLIVSPGDLCRATSIVAIRVPGLIVIAADSAGTFEGRNKPSSTKPVCKIYQSGGMFFAVAGFVDDPVTHFNVAHIVIEAARGGGSIRDKAEASASRLKWMIPREMPTLKADDPTEYSKMTSGKEDFTSILFFGLENGQVVAVGFGLKVAASQNARLKVVPSWRSCPGVDCSANGMYVFTLGKHDAIDRFYASNPPSSYVVWDRAEFLVGLEIAEFPESVRPPIDVLKVDSEGAHWIHHKRQCPDIQK
jgi:hypothetical protein